MRVRARDELARQHEALLGKVEVEDAVAGIGVVGLLQSVNAGELAADRGLAVVILAAREHEVVVGDRGLAGMDRLSAGDLVERVDREGRGPVGGGQQVRVHAQGRAGLDDGVLVHAVRPDDLLGRRHAPRQLGLRPFTSGRASTDLRNSLRPTAKMPPLERISSSLGERGTGV